jgi:hypothetical protein
MRTLFSAILLTPFLVAPATLTAESIRFKSNEAESQTVRVQAEVITKGKVFTSGGGGKTIDLDLDGRAQFSFFERRLAPAGRDAQSFRAVREFQLGRTDTTVGGRNTHVELPASMRLIVANGESFGVRSYCLEGPMTREGLDLLELPGDSLALSALLPQKAIEEGGEWNAPEWAAQMLGAVEAIEKASATCKLVRLTDSQAEIEVSAAIKGQRQGANCDVKITGTIEYDRSAEMISAGTLDYDIKSAVGAVSPGLEAKVHMQVNRSVSPSPGRLTDRVVNAIPISPEEGAFDLVFDAAPWGTQLRHGRGWYLFHAVMEGASQVAILRMIDRGSLIAQCNMAPVPAVSPGQSTPVEQFEKDVRTSLGKRLQNITSREQVEMGTDMKVIRIVAEGSYTLKGTKGEELNVPTHWIYYLCSAPSGRQASFVFAVESNLLEQLGDQDEKLVRSLQFVENRSEPTPRPVERTSRAKP